MQGEKNGKYPMIARSSKKIKKPSPSPSRSLKRRSSTKSTNFPGKPEFLKTDLRVLYESFGPKGGKHQQNLAVERFAAIRTFHTGNFIVNVGGKPLDVSWAPVAADNAVRGKGGKESKEVKEAKMGFYFVVSV